MVKVHVSFQMSAHETRLQVQSAALKDGSVAIRPLARPMPTLLSANRDPPILAWYLPSAHRVQVGPPLAPPSQCHTCSLLCCRVTPLVFQPARNPSVPNL